MALSVREWTGKQLLAGAGAVGVLPCAQARSGALPTAESAPWVLSGALVAKPDVLLKRRGKADLLVLGKPWAEVETALRARVGTEHEAEGLAGVLDTWLVEPFVPHTPSEEFYVALRTQAKGDELLFCDGGGVDVGDVDSRAKRLMLESPGWDPDYTPTKEEEDSRAKKIAETLLRGVVPAEYEESVARWLCGLYTAFVRVHASYVELNPVVLRWGTDGAVTMAPPQRATPECRLGDTVVGNVRVHVLDCAMRLDHTAETLCARRWAVPVEWPAPFGRPLTAEERRVRALDGKTGASLKLTVLNPRGAVWTLVAGGGASVVYADCVCGLGYARELANYGEYSGAPSKVTTYEYAKTVLGLVVAHPRPEGKALLIGGGIANFTNVLETFSGIIKAIQEVAAALVRENVRIYVRRGGPNYNAGLKEIYSQVTALGIPIYVYGPETAMTGIVGLALFDLFGDEATLEGAAGTPLFGDAPAFVQEGRRAPVESPLKTQVERALKARAEKPTPAPALFTPQTRCAVYGLQTRAVQEMLDFDHVCGRRLPSVAAIVNPYSASHLRPFYFGTEEIFVPVVKTLREALEGAGSTGAGTPPSREGSPTADAPLVDTLINFASLRSAPAVVEEALEYKQLKTICVIAEGIPERVTRAMGASCRAAGVTLIGPSTVGGLKPGALRLGNTGGSLENIMNTKLYRRGSVGCVTKSGGMLNELNNILRQTDGTFEAIAIGGDRFPGTSLLEHLLRLQKDCPLLVMLGEVGGTLEYEVAEALRDGRLHRPLVAWCTGTCATELTTEVSFGHAGAVAAGAAEHAGAKNEALRAAGALVPRSFSALGAAIRDEFARLVAEGSVAPPSDAPAPRVPMDYKWAKQLGLVRRPKTMITTISDERGEELMYAGWPISRVVGEGVGIGGVVSLLWFNRPLPTYLYKYFELVLMLCADHGPAVCGAHNTIVTARAGKDLISSLISGLCTIGNRFGGACDAAAVQFLQATREHTPEEFVAYKRERNELIMGIGHRVKSVHNPDRRVSLLKDLIWEHFPKRPCVDYAFEVEGVTTRKKDSLILNVDGLLGASMVDVLFHSDAFTKEEAESYLHSGCINGLFVLGRSIGFIAHYLDQKRLKQGLYRHDVDDIAYAIPNV